jgi:AraC family transcriptional regulator
MAWWQQRSWRNLSIEASYEAPGIEISICRWNWRSSFELIHKYHYHSLSLSLSPPPAGLRGFLEVGEGRRASSFSAMGPLIFNPAGVTLHNANDGGCQRLLICHIDPARMPIDERHMEQLNLTECLNLRHASLRAGLRRLAQETACPGFAQDALVEGLISTITVDLVRALGARAPESAQSMRGTLAPHRMRRIRNLVENIDIGRLPTVSEIATHLEMSTRHLLRAFRASMDMTIQSYLEDVNSERAKRLLAKGDMPLRDVATAIGFSSQSSFSYAFRRMNGETPAAFRRRLLGSKRGRRIN